MKDNVIPEEAVFWFKSLGPKLLSLGKLLLIALIVLLVGRKLIKWLGRLLERSFERANMEPAVAKFLITVVNVLLNILLIVLIAGILGLETSSLVALVGSAGLTVGLALQGSLSNFAGGVLILLTRPFRLGDYIIAGTNEGTVTAVDIFYTRLLTIDNRLVVIPNGTLSNSSIINVTSEPVRRLDLFIPVDYSENIKKAKDILSRLAYGDERVLKDRDIDIFVNSFEASSVTLGVRMWVEKENYWLLKWDMLERIKETFDQEKIAIPFDQLDINIRNSNN